MAESDGNGPSPLEEGPLWRENLQRAGAVLTEKPDFCRNVLVRKRSFSVNFLVLRFALSASIRPDFILIDAPCVTN